MRDDREKAETARNTPLFATIYTQVNFNTQPFIVDYINWQKRFKQDVASFDTNMKKNHEYGRGFLKIKTLKCLKKLRPLC
jgi:hypothetical protein